MIRHFLDIKDHDPETLRAILDGAHAMKSAFKKTGKPLDVLAGKTLAMIFEKPSTRTRVSFDVAMFQLGGHAITLRREETQLGRGETVADTAKALSRFVDAILLRTFDENILHEFAAHSKVPVINGLTDQSHPCQIMADVMTVEERLGNVRGKIAAWCGDGNNVAVSWIHAAVKFGFTLRLACPESLLPPQSVLQWAGESVIVERDVKKAAKNADVIVTDTWSSMGFEDSAARQALLRPYQVNADIMRLANPNAIFLHCLPAHRGEEVTADVIDGPQSAVWDEAENRLHAQKAILRWCLGK